MRPDGVSPMWWLWVGAGVTWGLLCVGVRLAALRTGHSMDELVARRHALLARVQELERKVAEARRFEQIEIRASALGFVKPGSRRILIVPPEVDSGFLSRLFKGDVGAASAGETASDGGEENELRIRPREEVVVKKNIRRAASGGGRRRKRR